MFGYLRDIDLAFAAQAYPIAAVGQFAEEDRDLHIAHREGVVDQAFAIFFACAEALHLLACDPDPGERTFAMEMAEGRSEEAKLGGGVSEINGAGTLRGIGS